MKRSPSTQPSATLRRVVLAIAVAVTSTLATSVAAAWTTPARAATEPIPATINAPAGNPPEVKTSPDSGSATVGKIDAARGYSVLCSRTADNGDPWDLITPSGGPSTGIGYVPAPWVTTPGGVRVGPCGGDLGQGTGANEQKDTQQCAALLANARQIIEAETDQVLFSQFITNYIENNAQRWAAALVAAGDDKAPAPADSALVSDAINKVAASSYDIVNATVEAFKKLAEEGVRVPAVDCSNRSQDDVALRLKDDTFKRLAEKTDKGFLEKLLGQIAGIVADAARNGVSSDNSYRPPNSTSTSQ
ncbi:hypothetical protein [Actinoallomurus rhizosphaericola]|uniref:hypothetical protein n=1 Tax=Actinoallomurus rhizosphaericola TaxID=2952536 RepID=UPI0020936BA2|nr:hypothetical protein [Actinoallomurus rhizosphaericola]MCO5998643.1 hypothetical protein [Actinoallomurus rhizosphaericola]